MSELLLKCTTAPGSDIRDCIKQAKKFARKYEVAVELEFNGVILHVYSDSSTKWLVDCYYSLLMI